jgi:hypothetical protein
MMIGPSAGGEGADRAAQRAERPAPETERCDAFEVADTITAEIVARSLAEFDVFYQPAADGSQSAIQQRYAQRTAQIRCGACGE